MAWLLDTNVLSELRRLRPDPNVVAFVAAQPLDQLYISAVTLAELRFGIELLNEGRTYDSPSIDCTPGGAIAEGGTGGAANAFRICREM